MDGVLAAIEASSVASWARTSRWGYAAVSATHIFGIALLVGTIVPLNLVRMRLVAAPHEAMARLLVPCAGVGLALAIATGAVLFSARAEEYAGLSVFQAKVALVAFGAVSAVVLHRVHGWFMERAPPARRAGHAAGSILTWLLVLLLGRLIAFAG